MALEGHDGSGKTTLAKRLAARLDAAYVRPYGGAQGAEMLTAAERGDHQRALDLAQSLANKAIGAASSTRLVCDRLWLTVFTLVPEGMFERWGDRAPTAVCWADTPTTLERLGERSEASQPTAWHEHYLSRYRDLAQQFDCPIIRTDMLSEEQALGALTDWAQAV